MKNKIGITTAIIVGLALGVGYGVGSSVLSADPASPTQPDFICPETGNGWVKFDGINSATALATAPTGSLIAEVCYKAGTNQAVYLVGPVASTLIVSTLVNNGGQVADISHYSIRLVPAVTPTSTPTPEPTVTVTPTPEPTRTLDPSPEPTLIPPIAVVPDEPVLAPTGLEGWFWGLLTLAAGLTVAGWWGVRRSHDSGSEQ